jgi:hypothetical protein
MCLKIHISRAVRALRLKIRPGIQNEMFGIILYLLVLKWYPEEEKILSSNSLHHVTNRQCVICEDSVVTKTKHLCHHGSGKAKI